MSINSECQTLTQTEVLFLPPQQINSINMINNTRWHVLVIFKNVLSGCLNNTFSQNNKLKKKRKQLLFLQTELEYDNLSPEHQVVCELVTTEKVYVKKLCILKQVV